MTATANTLRELAETVRLIVRPDAARKPWTQRDEWQKNANDYRLTLVYQGRRYSFDFWQGVGITSEPDAAGVLECLLSDATAEGMTFGEWCGEYGYDEDSRSAHRTYRACVKVGGRLRKLLGDDFGAFVRCQFDD